jgi:hypothetical protein
LLQFLRDYGEVALRVAEELSRNYYSAYEEIRTLGFTSSPGLPNCCWAGQRSRETQAILYS